MTRHQMLQHFALPCRKGKAARAPALRTRARRTRSARAAWALAVLTLVAPAIAQLLPPPQRSATGKARSRLH
jgi:hypothetical protein